MSFFETLAQVLGNSHFEAWIAGPLLGAMAGAAFAAITKPPNRGGNGGRGSAVPSGNRSRADDAATPGDDEPPRRVREVHHHHYHAGQRPGGGDDWVMGLVVILGFALVIGLLFFAAYLPMLAWTLYFGISSVAMFCITVLSFMLLSGRYDIDEWLSSAGIPLLVSVGCLGVTVMARNSIGEDVVASAQGLLGSEPLNVSIVASAAWKFFGAIGNEYAVWMLLEMVAFVLVLVCTLLVFGQSLNFVAAVNASASDRWAWRVLARVTRRVSGTGGTVTSLVLLSAAGMLASGLVFQWTR